MPGAGHCALTEHLPCAPGPPGQQVRGRAPTGCCSTPSPRSVITRSGGETARQRETAASCGHSWATDKGRPGAQPTTRAASHLIPRGHPQTQPGPQLPTATTQQGTRPPATAAASEPTLQPRVAGGGEGGPARHRTRASPEPQAGPGGPASPRPPAGPRARRPPLQPRVPSRPVWAGPVWRTGGQPRRRGRSQAGQGVLQGLCPWHQGQTSAPRWGPTAEGGRDSWTC